MIIMPIFAIYISPYLLSYILGCLSRKLRIFLRATAKEGHPNHLLVKNYWTFGISDELSDLGYSGYPEVVIRFLGGPPHTYFAVYCWLY